MSPAVHRFKRRTDAFKYYSLWPNSCNSQNQLQLYNIGNSNSASPYSVAYGPTHLADEACSCADRISSPAACETFSWTLEMDHISKEESDIVPGITFSCPSHRRSCWKAPISKVNSVFKIYRRSYSTNMRNLSRLFYCVDIIFQVRIRIHNTNRIISVAYELHEQRLRTGSSIHDNNVFGWFCI